MCKNKDLWNLNINKNHKFQPISLEFLFILLFFPFVLPCNFLPFYCNIKELDFMKPFFRTFVLTIYNIIRS